MAKPPRPSKTIVFLHPDLGIGGAERLVVDAAVGLQNRGHKVVIFTSHCDPKHCFEEARDGTLDVRVRGNTVVPPSILSRFSILCAILRQAHLLLQIGLFSAELRDLRPDAFFVDQLSAGLPFLSLLLPSAASPSARVLFYCHFPDLLLVRGRTKWWRRLYRVPFDKLEEWSMGAADAVAVNSGFTRGVVARTWPKLAAGAELRVVYPCVDVNVDDGAGAAKKKTGKVDEGIPPLEWKGCEVVLSINRFERKKNIALAIRAYAGLPEEKRRGVKLVIAGGYDNRVNENVSYHAELTALAESLGLRAATAKNAVTALALASADNDDDDKTQVLFLLSISSLLKNALLRAARLLVYTPAEEHFGIVPLEAMLRGLPVLACDSGGPTETVVEGVTGWLRDPQEVGSWTDVMDLALHQLTESQRVEMAKAGPKRVRESFSIVQMAERLDTILDEIETLPPRRRRAGGGGIALSVSLVLGLAVLCVAVVVRRLLF